MDIHKNARLTLIRREELAMRVIEQGETMKAAAAAFMVSARTAAKWVRRYRLHGRAGLCDLSSRPHRMPRSTSVQLVERVELQRRQRWTGCRIALDTALSRATVSRILRRLGLNHIRDLEPAPPVVRYEHAAPGDLLHLDIKKIGRFASIGCRITGHRKGRIHGQGWEYVHVAIDDHSRIAYAEIFPNQNKHSAQQFLSHSLAYFARLGIAVRGLLTDNGPCYRSLPFRQHCLAHSIRQRFTRPYTPRTNGKAERFIQTALREWAYARTYETSEQRATELPRWIHQYNWHRPHTSLNFAAPISRSGLEWNNLLTHHT